MFDKDSRYAKLPVKTLTDPTGQSVSYVARRIIPEPEKAIASIKVQSGDRSDLIASRAYGEARLFWRIADANPSASHTTLTIGQRLQLNQIKPE